MKPSRHQRLFKQITLFTMVALLWSQFALAGHPPGSVAFPTLDAGTLAGSQHNCAPAPPPGNATVCAAHCGKAELSQNARRLPPVPAALALPVYPIALITASVDKAMTCRVTPPVASWHRPTLHPASILLL